jgi:hypothetical protein
MLMRAQSLFNYVDFNAFIYFNLGELNMVLGGNQDRIRNYSFNLEEDKKIVTW